MERTSGSEKDPVLRLGSLRPAPPALPAGLPRQVWAANVFYRLWKMIQSQ